MRRKICMAAITCMTFVLSGCDGRAVNNVIQKLQQNANSSSSTSRPQLSPKATMQYFINNCQSGNADGAKKFFCRDLRYKMGEGDDFTRLGLRMLFQKCRITDVEENYGSATVYVKIQNPVTGEWATIPFPMILEDGKWKISELHED